MSSRFLILVLIAAGPCLQSLGAAPQRYNHGNPTAYEQLMLELVNQTRANPAAEAARLGIGLNDNLPAGTITTAAKEPLAFQSQLIAAGRVHSQWMLDEDIFNHTGAGGSDGFDRMTDAGYVFSSAYTWGENIAWGGWTGALDPLPMTYDLHNGLFRSAGHRKNICGTGFRQLGIGILEGSFQGYNALMATQNFAASSAYPDPWLLGVVFRDLDKDGAYDVGEGVSGVTVALADGSWDAVTSTSGGYAMPCAGSGPLNVTFTGASLTTPVTRTISRAGVNVKLDLVIAPAGPKVPEIAIFQPTGSGLSAGASSRSFGKALKGKNGITRTFTITNTGTASLDSLWVFSGGKHPKDFKVRQAPVSSLAPGKSTTFRVTFCPRLKGKRTAILRVRSSDGDENPFSITVSGQGLTR
jgi:hypothetical protein